jgi:hypothetical protein
MQGMLCHGSATGWQRRGVNGLWGAAQDLFGMALLAAEPPFVVLYLHGPGVG